MAHRRDFYEVLGVGRKATQDEIQRAYRKLVRVYHPDVNKDPGAEDRFKEITEAYEVLSDPATRRRYDSYGPGFRRMPEGAPWGHPRPGQGRRTTGVPGFDFDIDLGDLLGGMFGGRRAGPVPGADQEAELELSVEEAYEGGRRDVTLPGPGGPRALTVTIPPGVVEGQRIRLAGKGGHGTKGARAGDLYLVVRLAPHPRYRVSGRDVTVELPLTPWEAALGATVPVGTLRGEAKVRVPPGTSSGRRLRLRGRGMPNPRGADGDLFAEARIKVPAHLTEEERRLFERLAAVSRFDPRTAG
ncbi:molecular chaperone DnaJ [Microtetraspora sp. NBRC 13810]|uniref:DnaJ C-terminal domain-containing protein n=1 Tax=Microtetraspora sp. NBRC 13810 TaxID=3030990 RepID=UPI0024A05014|nr:DnaJ C-terminal domain-containing protein [Microtetraspora sp. NBRC 13810]GLW06727.1 molecular chaperone DnaJ [Microtetraspora sp. NBRC 13810]